MGRRAWSEQVWREMAGGKADLFKAADDGDLAKVKQLIEGGADVRAKDNVRVPHTSHTRCLPIPVPRVPLLTRLAAVHVRCAPLLSIFPSFFRLFG